MTLTREVSARCLQQHNGKCWWFNVPSPPTPLLFPSLTCRNKAIKTCPLSDPLSMTDVISHCKKKKNFILAAREPDQQRGVSRTGWSTPSSTHTAEGEAAAAQLCQRLQPRIPAELSRERARTHNHTHEDGRKHSAKQKSNVNTSFGVFTVHTWWAAGVILRPARSQVWTTTVAPFIHFHWERNAVKVHTLPQQSKHLALFPLSISFCRQVSHLMPGPDSEVR